MNIVSPNVPNQILSLPLDQLREAPWNANQMDLPLLAKLKRSVERFGLVGVLVARPLAADCYEVLSGNQRLQVLRDLGWETVLCLVIEVSDAEARLLALTLNRLHGSDDLGLKAQLMEHILIAVSTEEVLSLLPETAQGLQALSSLNHETLGQHLQNWQRAQAARLVTFSAKLTPDQLETVQRALIQLRPQARDSPTENPNPKGNALYLMALNFLNE